MKAGWFFLQHQELNKFTTMMLLSLVFFLDRVGLSVTLAAVLFIVAHNSQLCNADPITTAAAALSLVSFV